MERQIEDILAAVQPGIACDGAKMELTGIDDEGTIRLLQVESSASSQTEIWTHRLRVERAIRQKYPDAVFKVTLQAEGTTTAFEI